MTLLREVYGQSILSFLFYVYNKYTNNASTTNADIDWELGNFHILLT